MKKVKGTSIGVGDIFKSYNDFYYLLVLVDSGTVNLIDLISGCPFKTDNIKVKHIHNLSKLEWITISKGNYTKVSK